MNSKFYKQDDESLVEYKTRLALHRMEYGLTWQQVADLLNSETNHNYSESKYRKELSKLLVSHIAEPIMETRNSESFEDDEDEDGDDFMLQLKILTNKMQSQRSALNRSIKVISREETVKEIGKQSAEILDSRKWLDIPTKFTKVTGNNCAIWQLSDWHSLLEIDNYWNKFNRDICVERVNNYVKQAIDKCLKNNVKKVYIMNLGDLICGRIHAQLQIESQEDVIGQTIFVCDLLTEVLLEASKHFEVEFYNCLDNHSRVEPDKKKSLDLESFGRIIPWHLASRHCIYNNPRINIHIDNEFANDIITTNILGWNIAGVHGDHDKPNAVTKNLTLMCRRSFDLILTSHLHHFSADEQNECMIISNPSLMGTDGYAKNLRLCSRPAQNLIIVTEDNPVEAVYRILV